MLSPAVEPCAGLFDMISHFFFSYAKPAVIEICNTEIESYIADFGKQVGIRLVMKKQINYTGTKAMLGKMRQMLRTV